MKTWQDLGIEIQFGGPEEQRANCPQCEPSRKHKNGKPLAVNIRKECWECHNCGWKAGLGSGEQVRAQPNRWKKPEYARPVYIPQAPTTQLITFFEERGISPATIERYKITLNVVWMPHDEDWVPAIQFPYYRDDDVINIKSRSLDKHFKQVFDAQKILYGLNDILESETAIFVEGECDKLAFAEAGIFYAVSVPDGAPGPTAKPSEKKFEYIENCETYLTPLTKIYLATDADAPGRALEQELARRLGPERCWRVHWPEGIKDANELLVRDGVQALHDLLETATPWPIEGIVHTAELASDVHDYYLAGRTRGLSTGWENLNAFYTIREGQVTVVTGIPGHGKSEFLDALMVNLCAEHDWLFAVCSPENRPIKYHLAKLIEKVSGQPFLPGPTERISPASVAAWLEYLNEHVIFIDPDIAMTIPKLLAKAKALVLREGITGLIVDPWNEFDHTRPNGMTETDYISQCLSLFKNFSKAHGVHVWIVAHPAKLKRNEQGGYPVPTPYDIAGSANWINKPDCILTVWRNVCDTDHYVEVHVQKIRWKEIGHVGVTAYYWNPVCGRYAPTDVRQS